MEPNPSANLLLEQSALSEKHRALTSLSGIHPPQNATFDQHWPLAAFLFYSRFPTVVVGGIEFKGISTTVVTPPDIAALVPVRNPSQSVRPGSLR